MILSTLRNLGRFSVTAKNALVPKRLMSDHRTFTITPSRFQWNKFKDLVHMYTLVGAIPLGLLVFYCNVFIGPAQLAEIPEDYVPKHWEYYKHPITRFIARNILPNPQQEYEKYLSHIFMEDEKRRLRILEKEVKEKIAERGDYQAYYYRPILAKYHRQSKEAADYIESIKGE